MTEQITKAEHTAQMDEVRVLMRRATATVFEVLLEQYSVDDRIAVLRDAWNRTVLPALESEAERRALELEAFKVPFPADIKR